MPRRKVPFDEWSAKIAAPKTISITDEVRKLCGCKCHAGKPNPHAGMLCSCRVVECECKCHQRRRKGTPNPHDGKCPCKQ